MHLKKLNITDYKNISSSELEFGERINCFVGSNGAGKTNFLDAIYYLSLCKAINGTTDRQSIKHESPFFMVEGEYLSDDSHNIFNCSYMPSTAKVIKRNGKNYTKISEHIGSLPLVSITPSDNSLIDESGDARRKYLNTFISQISSSYLASLIKYNSIIVQRNIILKQEIEAEQLEIIEVYDMQLCVLAHEIYNKRCEIIAELSPIVSQYYSILSGNAEEVNLGYSSSLNKYTMEELLNNAFERDKLLGHTSVGVGRDDLKMTIGGYPIKRFGSQGQQKSFIIAMKLAQYDIMSKHKGFKPLLLLDDIFDRLDGSRVEALLALVSGDKFGQVFITDCDGERITRILCGNDDKYRVFNVKNGEAQWRKNIL